MMKRILSEHGIGILAVLGMAGVIAVISYYEYVRIHQNDIQIKSQYTYEIRINSDFDVVDEEESYTPDISAGINVYDWVDTISLVDVARTWMVSYLGQMEGRFVPGVKALKNSSVDAVNVINAGDNTVLIGFSAEAFNKESDYFDSWEGYVSDGKMICEWVVGFDIENLYDGTAKVRPMLIRMPEEYGIEKYTSSGNPIVPALENDKTSEAELYRYQFSDNKIQITFDGGEKWVTVPAESAYLLQSYTNKDPNTVESKRMVDEGTYFIDSQGAAFLYGGVAIGGKTIPFTIIYTKDRGEHWVSAQISDITDVNFAYLNFFSENDGIIVAGYDRRPDNKASAVYKTSDGGENWELVGETPIAKSIIGAVFFSNTTGFISYRYDSDMTNTLMATFDCGRTFSPVLLEEQQLSDNAGGMYQWSQVFVQANTPTLDSAGRLTLLVTQSADSRYSNSTVAARYSSDDNGRTWKYVDQIDTQLNN